MIQIERPRAKFSGPEEEKRVRLKSFIADVTRAVTREKLDPANSTSIWTFLSGADSYRSPALQHALLIGDTYNREGEDNAMRQWKEKGMPSLQTDVIVAVNADIGIRRAPGQIIGVTGFDKETGTITGIANIYGKPALVEFRSATLVHLKHIQRKTPDLPSVPRR